MSVVPPVRSVVQGAAESAVALRRALHAHPELGWTEYATTWRIHQELSRRGIEQIVWGHELYSDVERLGLPDEALAAQARADALEAGVPPEFLAGLAGGRTGLIATLDSGRPGPHICLRADIDALAVPESRESAHRPHREGFDSRRPGVSHACGHDGHAATAVLVAAALTALGAPERGRVSIVFQPAEEGARGAHALVQAGWLDDVDLFLSLHNASRDWFRRGDVSIGVHDMLATVKVDAEFEGREAHAALAPELGRSALTAASAVALLVPALPRRKDRSTVTAVGELHAGTSRNVVPGAATLRAELRSTDETEVAALLDRFEQLVLGVGQALEISTTTRVVGRSSAAASDPELMAVVERAISALPGVRAVPSMEYGASDDAAVMMRHVQQRGGLASYLHIGNDFPGRTHTPLFDLTESTLTTGAEVLTATILDLVVGWPSPARRPVDPIASVGREEVER